MTVTPFQIPVNAGKTAPLLAGPRAFVGAL